MVDLPPELRDKLASLTGRRRTPVSTYRLQLHKDFTFNQARDVVDYLSDLGVTDLYVSPILKALPGSTHGYDICDHNALNPELGTTADFEALSQALHAQKMGLLVDFVPNHMGIDPQTNPWWRDVLENGRASPYATFFDIDWDPLKPELKGKVLLPILGDQYGSVLERGELHLAFEEGSFWIRYFDTRLPVNPRMGPRILRAGLDGLKKELPPDDPALQEFLSILTELEHMPTINADDSESVAERQREKEIARGRLVRLLEKSPRFQQHVAQGVTVFNGVVGDPRSFDSLHDLLELQAYRLAYWKTAMQEINYRRFFDINQLAGIRMEVPDVFTKTHRLILQLLAEEKITGLRLDHPDGLFDPTTYFEDLQDAFLRAWAQHDLRSVPWSPALDEAVHDWRLSERKKEPRGLAAKPLYLSAEKILTGAEELPETWVIDGTTGYDFLNDVNRLWVPEGAYATMKALFGRFVDSRSLFADILYACKKLIMSTSMASELQVLAQTLNRLSEKDRRFRDFTLHSLREALREVIACFPVYRTYINASRGSAMDRAVTDKAIAEAARRNPAAEPSIFQFIRAILIPENAEKVPLNEFRQQTQFAMKVQQYTAPVQAKGMEDTAFYRYNPLMALNEVGGYLDTDAFGVHAFHQANARRQAQWPHTLLATSTHDTKRGEDARTRLAVLSEIPDEWEKKLQEWSRLAGPYHSTFEDLQAPTRYDEYNFYQSLLGAWSAQPNEETPAALAERMRAYMLKMIREAKVHTSWINPNPTYEDAVARFVTALLEGPGGAAFLAAFTPFARRVAHVGAIYSLGQVLLKLASPGVPDIYQGSEFWNLDLVDPDNRRPVDYSRRRKGWAEIRPFLDDPGRARQAALQDWLENWTDGRIKQFVTATALRFRRDHAPLFLEGTYEPLKIGGTAAQNVVGFGRRIENEAVLVLVPRLLASVLTDAEGWSATPFEGNEPTPLELPAEFKGSYRNMFTGQPVPANDLLDGGKLLSRFPLALLHRTTQS